MYEWEIEKLQFRIRNNGFHTIVAKVILSNLASDTLSPFNHYLEVRTLSTEPLTNNKQQSGKYLVQQSKQQ